jgi:hypothetical protein
MASSSLGPALRRSPHGALEDSKTQWRMPNRRSPLFLFGLTKRPHPLLKAVRVDPRYLNRRGPVRGPHMSNVELFERHPARSLLRQNNIPISPRLTIKQPSMLAFPLRPERPLQKKQIGFVYLLALGKSVSERHPVREWRKNRQPTRFGSSPVRRGARA